MKTALLLMGVAAALLIAGAQNSDSGARNAVGAPRPSLSVYTANSAAPQSGARAAVNTNTTTSPTNTADTLDAATNARSPK